MESEKGGGTEPRVIVPKSYRARVTGKGTGVTVTLNAKKTFGKDVPRLEVAGAEQRTSYGAPSVLEATSRAMLYRGTERVPGYRAPLAAERATASEDPWKCLTRPS